jgi:hypothetical protein
LFNGLLGVGHAFYAGDDREFSAFAAQYRVGHHATISMGGLQPTNPPSPVPLFNDPGYSIFGESAGYDEQDGIPSNTVPGCPWRLGPGAQPRNQTTRIPDGQNWQFTRTQVAYNSALIHFHARASNPAFPLPSPAIRVEMTLDMVQEVDPETGEQGMAFVSLSGSRTFFPAHEVWINGHDLHKYDPRVRNTQPAEGLALFMPIDPVNVAFPLP